MRADSKGNNIPVLHLVMDTLDMAMDEPTIERGSNTHPSAAELETEEHASCACPGKKPDNKLNISKSSCL